MITQTQTTSFKTELYQGVHNLIIDQLYMALYIADANLGAATTEYTSVGEISDAGYTAGGVLLTNVTVNSYDYTAYVSFDNPSWVGAFTVRGALIYNASKSNRSIAVLNFGADKISTNTFTVTLPANTADSALIRSSN